MLELDPLDQAPEDRPHLVDVVLPNHALRLQVRVLLCIRVNLHDFEGLVLGHLDAEVGRRFANEVRMVLFGLLSQQDRTACWLT